MTARTKADRSELLELHALCREGRIYDVERWIKNGGRLQPSPGVDAPKARREQSALEIALANGQHSLVLLLLCNGYDPNLDLRCPLDLALQTRRIDLLDLLLDWGADPNRVSRSELFNTYESGLFERFRNLGVNLSDGHEMAEALAYHTSNKPLFGFAKRYREADLAIQRELNMALLHHANEGNEKGVMLSLWAGADPHAPVHSLRDPCDCDEPDDPDGFAGFTAIETACHRGDAEILKRLGPDPIRDDFERLYRTAANSEVIDVLRKHAPPKDIGAIVEQHLRWLSLPFTAGSISILERLFETGARWHESPRDQVQRVRRSLMQMSGSDLADAIRLLATKDYAAPEILHQLGRTPAIQRRMKETGFLRPDESELRDPYQIRPRGYCEVIRKLGLQPKVRHEPKPLPSVVAIGSYSPESQELHLTRADLYERVWSVPVDKLASEWGLTGRGLAKACARLKIPVPPRGYWAKQQSGKRQRRTPLPKVKPDEAAKVVIRYRD